MKKAIDAYQDGIVVTEEYQAVFEALSAGAPIVFVSGKAGTGKSTLIRWIVEQRKWQTAVVAPTGIAALNVSGATIHSFFRLPPKLIEREDIREISNKSIYRNLQLLIIDEISMVRADLMDAIGWFLEINGPKPGEPFGGVQLLLVGDLFQLPPVVNQEDLHSFFKRIYASPYFFSAKTIKEASIIPIELEEIFRQKNKSFAKILNDVREGKNIETAMNALNEECHLRRAALKSEPHITLTPTNRVADFRNARALAGLPGESRVYAGRFKGEFDTRSERLPSPQNLELKVGAQVMFTKNGKLWVNGTLGIVRSLGEESVQVELALNASEELVDVEPVIWESIRYRWNEEEERIHKESIGQYRQIPLMLAWATTIHKAQGKTLDAVEIDFEQGAFASGQAYVALSRCRELGNITLTRPIRRSDVQCDPEIIRFYGELRRLTDEK